MKNLQITSLSLEMLSFIGTINLINVLYGIICILYSPEHVMCPAHFECQKFQILSPQLNVSLNHSLFMKTIYYR